MKLRARRHAADSIEEAAVIDDVKRKKLLAGGSNEAHLVASYVQLYF